MESCPSSAACLRPAPSPMGEYARASDELSFKRHDIIEVLGQDEEDDVETLKRKLAEKEKLDGDTLERELNLILNPPTNEPLPPGPACLRFVLTGPFDLLAKQRELERVEQLPGGGGLALLSPMVAGGGRRTRF